MISQKKIYNYFGDELRKVFNQKVYKISLNNNFTCPTRDGTKGTRGCFYCGASGSHFVNLNDQKLIVEQLKRGKEFLFKWYGVKKFIAYFQSYTSTYGDLSILENQCQTIIEDPDIVGINLATRPDCIDDKVLFMLKQFMLPRYHWLEIGLESSHNQTLKAVGRGHGWIEFAEAYARAKEMGFRICVHLILGLPGETEDMMLETVDRLIELKVDGIKFHNLHIVKNSVFETEYKKGKIDLLSLESYATLIGQILKKLPAETIIHRLVGEAPKDHLIAPKWSFHKQQALRYIEDYLIANNIEQSKRSF